MSSTIYGLGTFHPLPNYGMGAGIRTEFGSITPPGGKVAAYVHHSGAAITDDQAIAKMLYRSLNDALKQCRSGKGDVVFVLPGHAENVSSADQMSNLVAGTRIIGLGSGTGRPTFTWTAAAATFLLDVANVSIQNCILNLDPGTGTVNVAAPITISGAGCSLIGNQIRCGTDANSKVTIGITTTAAADDLVMAGNEIYGATAAECTTMLQFVGADRLQFIGNTIACATSAVGVGVVRFLTTASTNIYMFKNFIANRKASSTAAVTGVASMTGFVDDLVLSVLGNNAAGLTLGNAAGAWSTSIGTLEFGPNVSAVTAAGERAGFLGTAST